MDDFDAVPVNRFLGCSLVSRSSKGAELRMPVRGEFVQETGVVHGGVLATLADTAAVYAIWPDLDPPTTMASIEFKMNYLRPAIPDAGEITARSQVVQRGRRVALCLVHVRQGEEIVAMGVFTYLIFEETPAAGRGLAT